MYIAEGKNECGLAWIYHLKLHHSKLELMMFNSFYRYWVLDSQLSIIQANGEEQSHG